MWRSLLVLLTCGVVVEASPPVLLIHDAGYFLVVEEDGRPSIAELTVVVDLTGGESPPVPDAPEPPDDSPDVELTREVLGWAEAVGDPQGAQSLALTYRQMAGVVLNETLTVNAGIDAIREASDAALSAVGAKASWKEFRGKISQELNSRRQRGELVSPQGLSTFLEAAAHGLELAADGSQALDFNSIISIADKVNGVIDRAKK